MSWTQAVTDEPLLVFSILCAAMAAMVVAYETLNSRRNSSTLTEQEPSELVRMSQVDKRRRSILDRMTLLNRNLTQCPSCSRIEFANVRFCSRCGGGLTANGGSLSPNN